MDSTHGRLDLQARRPFGPVGDKESRDGERNKNGCHQRFAGLNSPEETLLSAARKER